jgi:hypothetical protein
MRATVPPPPPRPPLPSQPLAGRVPAAVGAVGLSRAAAAPGLATLQVGLRRLLHACTCRPQRPATHNHPQHHPHAHVVSLSFPRGAHSSPTPMQARAPLWPPAPSLLCPRPYKERQRDKTMYQKHTHHPSHPLPAGPCATMAACCPTPPSPTYTTCPRWTPATPSRVSTLAETQTHTLTRVRVCVFT